MPREDRRAEAVTVAWMLTTVATLAAEISGALALLAMRFFAVDADFPLALQAFPGLMLLAATVTGVITLLLMPLAYRFRQVPPPPLIAAFSGTIAAVPIAAALVVALR